MFDVGFTELLLLAIIAMVVVGPERLPSLARTVGKTIGQARRYMTKLQNQIEQEVKLDELNKKVLAAEKEAKEQAADDEHRDASAEAETRLATTSQAASNPSVESKKDDIDRS